MFSFFIRKGCQSFEVAGEIGIHLQAVISESHEHAAVSYRYPLNAILRVHRLAKILRHNSVTESAQRSIPIESDRDGRAFYN